ncbi:MAG: FAD-binding oxidoreductase [Leptolyngbya sp. Prado105]|jgi:glycine/D-amino acid oxidase-like deaminating enzyme|nr:FAD-binding oxidoreductase [Leptolyngbya sp. Prado105]
MKVTIAGCGVVGATIAYELSQVPEFEITVVEAQLSPIQADLRECPSSTGAALGVLMGAISQKEKGRNLRMRLFGIQYYNQLVPELEALTGRSIPFNRQGILMLKFPTDDLTVWHRLVEVRQQQDLPLELWDREQLKSEFPFLEQASAAIYSPSDRQINPVALTQALIEGAKVRGVRFEFGAKVLEMQGNQVQTSKGLIDSDYLVIAAGIGSKEISAIDIRPVLGQAIHLKLPKSLGNHLPVITGDDVHLVPLGNAEYWVGATVEFPTEVGEVLPPDRAMFDAVMKRAIEFCPSLEAGEVMRSWFGLRPRPQGRPAPVIEAIQPNVLLASGHYRNGVLLAPATANEVKKMILN